MKRLLILFLILALVVPMLPAPTITAQDGSCPPPRYVTNQYVIPADGSTSVALYANAGDSSPSATTPALFYVTYAEGELACISGENWYTIGRQTGWVKESDLAPYWHQPPMPQGISVSMNAPQITIPTTPLPAMTFNPAFPNAAPAFVSGWNWQAVDDEAWLDAPDPLQLQLPATENSGLPTLPVDLSQVYYSDVAGLNAAQLALMAQNGFVVVPAGDMNFMDDAYRAKGWEAAEGTADFITTDALLTTLFAVYENALQYLELGDFYNRISRVIASAYTAAEQNATTYAGTDVEANARNAAVYYAVALSLLADGGGETAITALQAANPATLAQAAPIVDMARTAEGRLSVPILDNVDEDFSQYKPRGYYAGNPTLEGYFRAMMWLGRITFRAANAEETLTAMFIHEALQSAFSDWAAMEDILAFMIGPMNNLSPYDYNAGFPNVISREVLPDFQAYLQSLPAPRVNTVVLEVGTTADEVDDLGRGYQLFGQRFTLDGYIMNELIYPQAGEAGSERILPLGLDVPTALGSDTAYDLIRQVGGNAYAHYDDNLSALRTEIDGFGPDAWLENLYGTWLWTLQPLALQSDLTPAMMRTDAWRYKDLNTFLGSWTQLKHATLLYTAQPMGGLGGGGEVPLINSYSYVEPQPLVFARIAIIAALLRQGLTERGIVINYEDGGGPLNSTLGALADLAVLSARLADYASRELAGEPLGYEDYYWLQENFGSSLWYIRYTVEFWLAEPPPNMAVVADVASNAAAGVVLEEGVGLPEYIYVVVPHPNGYQVTRGAVYSQYEFIQPIDDRLTDQAWREMVASNPPARHSWTSLYRSE